jgi:hypothetical protein
LGVKVFNWRSGEKIGRLVIGCLLAVILRKWYIIGLQLVIAGLCQKVAANSLKKPKEWVTTYCGKRIFIVQYIVGGS